MFGTTKDPDKGFATITMDSNAYPLQLGEMHKTSVMANYPNGTQ
ncbi:hypothetical protein [Paenibacillus marchantiophytorum]|nr:hypothetical protein [Paenibacillus marchantiophytorum]